MTLKYIVIAILVCCNYTHACIFSEYDSVVCSSLRDAVREGNQNWTNLKCKNFGNQSLTTLPYHSFQKSLKLNTLTIQGLLHGIQDGALNNLFNLKKLELFDNEIGSLPANLFEDVPMENLYLVNCGLRFLQKGTFNTIRTLRILYIRKNSIRTIPSDVFTGSSVEELYLENNHIQEIANFAFANMDKLVRLSLSGNFLKTFDVKLLLGTRASELNRLWLNKNQLTTITPDMFAWVPKMKYLFLEMNNISSIQDNGFKGIKELVTLDISNNQLDIINSSIFPSEGMQKLELFFFHNNRITFLTRILEKTPALKYVTMFGNPLQCPCYHKIKNFLATRNVTQVCAENDIQRPVCIFSEDIGNQNTCLYDTKKNKDLYDDYVRETAEYEPWEPKCNFGEGYTSIHWSKPYINP